MYVHNYKNAYSRVFLRYSFVWFLEFTDQRFTVRTLLNERKKLQVRFDLFVEGKQMYAVLRKLTRLMGVKISFCSRKEN